MTVHIKGVLECELCGDTGFRLVGSASERRAFRCECSLRQRNARWLAEAAIPWRYRDATLANYDCSGPREPLTSPCLWAKAFVESYPCEGERGAVLIGNCGTGKTHLSVGILKALIAKGFAGRFCDYVSLLLELRRSYDPASDGSETATLQPLLEVPVLVLDDLGATRISEWTLDTVMLLLNTRYLRGATTLITTNYPQTAEQREETLADRIGARSVSRLREMCRFVPMDGPDYRMKFAAQVSA